MVFLERFKLIPPPIPINELERIQELMDLDLLDTLPEERFDRLTRLAQRIFQVPVTLISLVDENRVWFKSKQGLAVTEVPREISFCAHSILGSQALVVRDATQDERFRDNPYVVEEPHIRFYAGFPLKGPKGHPVGTLCLIDYQPKEFSEEDQHCLGDLAALAEKEFGAERISRLHMRLLEEIGQLQSQALVDYLTRLWNRRAVLEILEMERSRALRKDYKVGLILADLDHFKDINDRYGHPVGDTVLAETALRIRSCFALPTRRGGMGGGSMIVLPEVGMEMAMKIAERIRVSIQEEPFPTPKGNVQATISLGVGLLTPDTESPLESLISKVDKALYQAKAGGRNRSCFFPEDTLTLFK